MSHFTSGRAGPFSGGHSRRSAAILLALCSLLILSGCTLVWAVPGGGGLTALLVGLVALGLAACTSSGGGGGGNGGDVTVINGHADEGDGNTTMTLTVVRSGGSGSLTVNWNTADGTAEAGTDYTADSGSVNVGADGSAQITISVNATDDGAFNGARWFALELSASGADSVTDGAGIIHEAETVLRMDTMPSSLGFVIGGEATGDRLAHSVSGAGDFNGDGIGDLIVGAGRAYDPVGSNYGTAYVIYGRSSGNADIDLDSLTQARGLAIRGANGGDYTGYAVRAAGDVNGDGLDDVIVGAHFADGGGSLRGQAHVVFGKASPPASINVGSLSASQGFSISGQVDNDLLGFSVSGAGDVNGDGFDDVIVGAPNANTYGAAYILFGDDSGLSDITVPPSASRGITIYSNSSYNVDLGHTVSAAGDFNGDGTDDVLVTDRFADVPFGEGSNYGVAYILFGKTTGLADIDVSAMSTSVGIMMEGTGSSDQLGRVATGLGDTNGDGLADIVAGAPYSHLGAGSYYGDAHVLFGTENPADVEVPLSNAQGFDIHGFPPSDFYNLYEGNALFSAGAAGDLNGDGLADLVFGNRAYTGYDGAGIVVFGQSGNPGNLTLPTSAGEGFILRASYESGDRVGHAVSGAGDINGDGFTDLLISASYFDYALRSESGVVFVIFGPF